MATTITRVSDSGTQAGTATKINLMGGLSAVRTGAGTLKLIAWRTGGPISRISDSGDQAGAVSEIALFEVAAFAVTAVRDGNGALKLISWDDGLTDLYPLVRRADSGDHGEPATLIAVTAGYFPIPNALTAIRAANGELKLITWHVSPVAPLTISRLHDSGTQAIPVDLVAVSSVKDIVVTAVRTTAGRFKLDSWRISPEGEIELGDETGSHGLPVREIAMAGTVAAVTDSKGYLRLIPWEVSPDGSTIKAFGPTEAQPGGQVSDIAIAQSSPTRYVTAVRTVQGNLRLNAFDVNGGTVTATGDSGNQAGAASDLTIDSSSEQAMMTAEADGNGNLRLINWRMTN